MTFKFKFESLFFESLKIKIGFFTDRLCDHITVYWLGLGRIKQRIKQRNYQRS